MYSVHSSEHSIAQRAILTASPRCGEFGRPGSQPPVALRLAGRPRRRREAPRTAAARCDRPDRPHGLLRSRWCPGAVGRGGGRRSPRRDARWTSCFATTRSLRWRGGRPGPGPRAPSTAASTRIGLAGQAGRGFAGANVYEFAGGVPPRAPAAGGEGRGRGADRAGRPAHPAGPAALGGAPERAAARARLRRGGHAADHHPARRRDDGRPAGGAAGRHPAPGAPQGRERPAPDDPGARHRARGPGRRGPPRPGGRCAGERGGPARAPGRTIRDSRGARRGAAEASLPRRPPRRPAETST